MNSWTMMDTLWHKITGEKTKIFSLRSNEFIFSKLINKYLGNGIFARVSELKLKVGETKDMGGICEKPVGKRNSSNIVRIIYWKRNYI